MASPSTVFARALAQDAPTVIKYRVESFDLREVPATGEFYSGDSYVVVNTIRNPSGSVDRKIYFWQGASSSIDERAGSAIFSKQLDDAFGGAPLESQEVQGQESDAFKMLFPSGLTYLEGGVASGLRDADLRTTTTPVKLTMVNTVPGSGAQASEVPAAVVSLNGGASFVLESMDTDTVYLWHGAGAGVFEKTKALDLANTISNTKSLKMIVLDQGDSSTDATQFFTLLGATDAAAAAASVPSA